MGDWRTISAQQCSAVLQYHHFAVTEWSTDLYSDAANLLASDAGDVVSAGLNVIQLFSASLTILKELVCFVLARVTRGQCYKIFYRGNLLQSHGNTLILCYKMILLCNYHEMLLSNTMVIYHGILILEKVGTAVNYYGIFITLAKTTMVF